MKLNEKKIWIIITLAIGIFIGILISPLCFYSNYKDIEGKLNNQEQALIEKDEEIKKLNDKIDLAKPWFEKTQAEQKAIEEENERKKAEEAREHVALYYVNDGYYFHDDINCRGLNGHRNNLNITYYDKLYEHQELSPCNWCVKVNR